MRRLLFFENYLNNKLYKYQSMHILCKIPCAYLIYFWELFQCLILWPLQISWLEVQGYAMGRLLFLKKYLNNKLYKDQSMHILCKIRHAYLIYFWELFQNLIWWLLQNSWLERQYDHPESNWNAVPLLTRCYDLRCQSNL